MAPLYTRPPATYREDWLQTYVPNESACLRPKQREELAAIGKRDPIYGHAGTFKKIYDRLLIDFSVNSARAAGQIRDESFRVSRTTYAPLDGRESLARLLLLLLEKARAITDPFEQSFFLPVHISYLQAFSDVNKRTARLASNIPLIRGDYVPSASILRWA